MQKGSLELSYTDDNQATNDRNLNVQFYTRLIDGKEQEFVKIMNPGDILNVVDQPVTEEHLARFQAQYAFFKGSQNETGTPIDNWQEIPEGVREELKYNGFRYIEQVASSPDVAYSRIMGGLSWRKKAAEYLNKAKKDKNEEIIKQQAETIATMKEMLETLSARLNAVETGGQKFMGKRG